MKYLKIKSKSAAANTAVPGIKDKNIQHIINSEIYFFNLILQSYLVKERPTTV